MTENRFNAGAILFSLCIIGSVCLMCRLRVWHYDQMQAAYQLGHEEGSATTKLLTVEQIQERIGATVDGKWGKETTRLYNIALCNQYAVDSFKKE